MVMRKKNMFILGKNTKKVEAVLLKEKIPISQRYMREETKLHPYTISDIVRNLLNEEKIKKIKTSGGTYYIWNDEYEEEKKTSVRKTGAS